MSRIDLKRYNATSFGFTAEFKLRGDDYSNSFSDYARQFDEGPIIVGQTYSRRKVQYSAYAFLFEREGARMHLQTEYRMGEIGNFLSDSVWTLDDTLELLNPIVGQTTLSISAQFVYFLDEYKSKLRLPIKLAPSKEFDYDEIRGLRLDKVGEKNDRVYSIIVDMPDDEAVIQSIRYSYAGELTDKDILDALKSGERISSKFIQPVNA